MCISAVMKLSIQGKSRPGRPHITLPPTAARKRGTHTALNRATITKNTKKVAKDEVQFIPVYAFMHILIVADDDQF